MVKVKLEPSAALVMRWGRRAFRSVLAGNFIDQLDLSSGEELYNRCSSICNWYGEVTLNRKHFINEFINNHLNKSPVQHIVVVLAAGKSPLSLEILSENYDKINKILEVDVAGMDEKSEIYSRTCPEFSHKIKCITADITSDSILSTLNYLLHEYYEDHPCIIVMEGVVYYLEKSDFKKIVRSFKSANRNNIFITEYLVPFDFVSEGHRQIPVDVFNTIQEHAGLPSIQTYTADMISEIFSEYGGQIIDGCSLTLMEKERLGNNQYFHQNNDGWIECSIWKI